jgi:hypothetical protein
MSLDTQIVGAFGEKAVEAELLRRGWRTANSNTSIKNAAHYDMIAWKDDRTVQVRVKTCGPGWNAFQFSSRPEQALPVDGLPGTDYTTLRLRPIRGGEDRPNYDFEKKGESYRDNWES